MCRPPRGETRLREGGYLPVLSAAFRPPPAHAVDFSARRSSRETFPGFLGDVDRAEEAAQEAFAIAAARWPRDGHPDNPRARLVTTAPNRTIDRVRRDHSSGNVVALDQLDLDDYLYLHTTRAELLRHLDRIDEARAA